MPRRSCAGANLPDRAGGSAGARRGAVRPAARAAGSRVRCSRRSRSAASGWRVRRSAPRKPSRRARRGAGAGRGSVRRRGRRSSPPGCRGSAPSVGDPVGSRRSGAEAGPGGHARPRPPEGRAPGSRAGRRHGGGRPCGWLRGRCAGRRAGRAGGPEAFGGKTTMIGLEWIIGHSTADVAWRLIILAWSTP
ncbi:Uncharacterised protein [Enterobacter cloacae]|nr:Uncharacterised protein [Enterobacter cloacae]